MTARPFAFRDEDGNLRLDEALGQKDAAHYVRILSSSSEEFRAMQLSMRPQGSPPGPGSPLAYGQDGYLAEGFLFRRGPGLPSRASSCRELEAVPPYCWDVCGYYRRLGAHWKATVRELRLAFLALDPRRESEPLCYALGQLLDPQVRRAYDRMPLGGLFMGDRDVQDMIMRQAAAESSSRMAGHRDGEAAGSYRDVLADWGFDQVSGEEARSRATAPPSPGPLPAGDGALRLGSAWKASWGYYVLVGPGHDERLLPGGEEMEAWQAMVAAALGRHGITAGFAVGAQSAGDPVTLRISNESCIVMLTGEPTPAKAEAAVRQGVSAGYIRQDRHRRHKRQKGI